MTMINAVLNQHVKKWEKEKKEMGKISKITNLILYRHCTERLRSNYKKVLERLAIKSIKSDQFSMKWDDCNQNQWFAHNDKRRLIANWIDWAEKLKFIQTKNRNSILNTSLAWWKQQVNEYSKKQKKNSATKLNWLFPYTHNHFISKNCFFVFVVWCFVVTNFSWAGQLNGKKYI